MDSLGQVPSDTMLKIGLYLRAEWLAKYGVPQDQFESASSNKLYLEDLRRQENAVDCGVFLIEYARRFLLRPFTEESANEYLRCMDDFEVWELRTDLRNIIQSP